MYSVNTTIAGTQDPVLGGMESTGQVYLNTLISGIYQSSTLNAITILRKFGTDAHVYLPGIGALNGLTAGNYLDSAGTTAATVDNPVGLVLDGAGGLGVQLISTPTSWSTGTGISVNTGASSVAFSGVQGAYAVSIISSASVATNSTYAVSFTVSVTQGAVQVKVGTTDKYYSVGGTYTYYIVASGTGVVLVQDQGYNGSRFIGTVSNISVKEVTGIHASQATTANKPILRQTSGKYSLQFDGVNDSLGLGSVPFQMADAYAVIGAMQLGATGTIQTLYAQSSGSSSSGPVVGVSAAGIAVTYINGGGGGVNASGGAALTIGTPAVISSKSTGVTVVTRRNGAQVASGTLSGTYATSTVAGIGSNMRVTPTEFANGNIGPVIAIKGTVTDAELLLLERFVASLTPNAPSF